MARGTKGSPKKATCKEQSPTDKELRDRAEFQQATADAGSPLNRAVDERFRQMREPSELVAFRMPIRLKAELEQSASASGRSLSGEMRFRLEQGAMTNRMQAEMISLLTSAVDAEVPHEQLKKLIKIHMESLERKRS